MLKAFQSWFLPFILWVIYRLISLTWRMRVIESPNLALAVQNNQRFVIAHWHGDELVLLSLIPRYHIATMTSTSRDGSLIDRIIKLQGGATSRGSSTRGGIAALKGILQLVRTGYRPSVAVDGPKGPLHKVKPGIFEISRVTNAPIFPIAVSASRSLVFRKSWNKTFLPLPFSRVSVCWGEGLPALSRDEDPRTEKRALALEDALHAAKRRAANR